MSTEMLAIILREAERALVDLGGILAICLGFQLFMRMPQRNRSEGKFEMPGGISIYVSRVGPGVFFSLFGAAILGLSLIHGITEDSTQTEPTAAASIAAATTVTKHFSGITPGSAADDPLKSDAERQSVLAAIRNLNRVSASLRTDLPTASRVDIDRAIWESKWRLLSAVWDSQNWGDYSRFREWLDQGEIDPPPATVAKAAEQFRAGSGDHARATP